MDLTKLYGQKNITIPLRLRDNNLTATKNHSSLIYIFCIIIRIIFGVLVFYNKIPLYIIYIVATFIISAFAFKYLKNINDNTTVWKNYIRCIINYMLVIVFTIFNISNDNNVAGLIIIVDALMGQQSRFIQSNFSI